MLWSTRRSSTADLQAVRRSNRRPKVCFLVPGPPCAMGLCTAGVFAGNSATVALLRHPGGGGGAVYVTGKGAALIVDRCQFATSTAEDNAGAMSVQGWVCLHTLLLLHWTRSLQLCSADFSDQPHSASLRCYCRIRSVVVTNSTFTANVAAGNGGGLFLADNQQQTVSGSTFTANVAASEHRLPQHT
jgi:hypothetical protein